MNPERWMRLARAIPRTLDSYSTPNRYVEAYEEGEPIPGTSCSLGASKSSILFCVLVEGFKRLSEVKKNVKLLLLRNSALDFKAGLLLRQQYLYNRYPMCRI